MSTNTYKNKIQLKLINSIPNKNLKILTKFENKIPRAVKLYSRDVRKQCLLKIVNIDHAVSEIPPSYNINRTTTIISWSAYMIILKLGNQLLNQLNKRKHLSALATDQKLIHYIVNQSKSSIFRPKEILKHLKPLKADIQNHNLNDAELDFGIAFTMGYQHSSNLIDFTPAVVLTNQTYKTFMNYHHAWRYRVQTITNKNWKSGRIIQNKIDNAVRNFLIKEPTSELVTVDKIYKVLDALYGFVAANHEYWHNGGGGKLNIFYSDCRYGLIQLNNNYKIIPYNDQITLKNTCIHCRKFLISTNQLNLKMNFSHYEWLQEFEHGLQKLGRIHAKRCLRGFKGHYPYLIKCIPSTFYNPNIE